MPILLVAYEEETFGDWKSIVLILLFLSLFLVIPIRIDKLDEPNNQLLFENFVKKYNKSYNDTEYVKRFANFQESLTAIQELNNNRTTNESALYGITEYSDLSRDEFFTHKLQHHLNRRKHHNRHHKASETEHHIDKRSITLLPTKVDWREKGVVGPVRNQKTCGACWAFSTVETIESMAAIKTTTLPSLSVQEIIDCARNGNMGCNGGDTCSLLEWLVDNSVKVTPEKEYPLNWKTNVCHLKGPEKGIRVASNFTCNNFIGKEDALMMLLATHGPVTAAVNALAWQHYLGGIVQYHCDGSPPNINHAVQIVGYDRSASIPHYIVRNSWGSAFGDKGYLYLSMGTNMCGVGTEVTSLDVIL